MSFAILPSMLASRLINPVIDTSCAVVVIVVVIALEGGRGFQANYEPLSVKQGRQGTYQHILCLPGSLTVLRLDFNADQGMAGGQVRGSGPRWVCFGT